MLQELSVKNFKLFDEVGVTVRPGKITVLIGANGTGKSSLLQVLLLLKQSRQQSQLILSGPLINVGSFQDVIHLQEPMRQLEVDISAAYKDLDISYGMQPPLPSSGTVRYHLSWNMQQGLVSQSGVIGKEDGVAIRASWNSHNPQPRYSNFSRLIIEGVASIELRVSTAIGQPVEASGYSSDPDSPPLDFRPKVNALLATIPLLLGNYYLVPAIRGFDNLTYEVWSNQQPEDLTAAGGPEMQATLTANMLSSSPDLVEAVTERLNAILQGKSRLRYRLDQGRLVSEMVHGRKGINLFNEAFGLNQLVAPLLWLSKVPSGSVIGIEEPEIHLHPRAQAALCDVFVEVATQERKQLILTTHSEHILMGLLTAVADGRLRPDDLAVYEFRREGDAARAERLAVNEYGQVAGGLQGFLEADLDEIGELIQARFQKQR